MSKRVYPPHQGDVIELSFQPASGRDADRRYAVVLSPQEYNRQSGLCIAAPVTFDMTPNSLWVPMPEGIIPQPGMILCDCVRSLDYVERGATRIGEVNRRTVEEIVGQLLDLIDPPRL